MLVILIFLITRIIIILYHKSSLYDTSLEVLYGSLIIALVLYYNSKNVLKINNTIKNLINLLAKFSYTLYILHLALEGLIIAIVVSYGLYIHPALLVIFCVLFSNLIAFLVAYPTEMQYKKLSRFLKDDTKWRSNIHLPQFSKNIK